MRADRRGSGSRGGRCLRRDAVATAFAHVALVLGALCMNAAVALSLRDIAAMVLVAASCSVAAAQSSAGANDTAAMKPSQAAAAKAAILRRWQGKVVGDATPGVSVIADASTLRRVWRAVRVGADVPDVDFHERVLVVDVVNATTVRCAGGQIDATGDLRPQFVVTPDQPGGRFSVAICEFARGDVRSVNSQPLLPTPAGGPRR